jgi:hypothetical protein
MRSRWLSTVLACGVSALLLGCLASPGVAAEYPATFQGTTANGGTVEFDVAADGATVTHFRATQVPMTCGISFDATVDGAFSIVGGSFSNGSPTTGLVFGGTFQAAQLAAGTVSYRIVNVRYDGCSSETVSWTATAPSAPPAPPQVPPADSERWPVASLRPRVLVSYRQEGGIGGPRPSLFVSKDHGARVSLGQCTASFELNPGVWTRLRAALKDAQIQTIAGVYPPSEGAADVITYVIKTRAGTVRIAPTSQPANEEVVRQLRPLLRVLNKTISAGEQRMSQSCKSGL